MGVWVWVIDVIQVVVKDPLSIQNIPRPQVYKNVQASKQVVSVCVGGCWGSVGVNKFTDTRQSIYPARQMSQAFSKSTAEQPPFRPTIKRSLSR